MKKADDIEAQLIPTAQAIENFKAFVDALTLQEIYDTAQLVHTMPGLNADAREDMLSLLKNRKHAHIKSTSLIKSADNSTITAITAMSNAYDDDDKTYVPEPSAPTPSAEETPDDILTEDEKNERAKQKKAEAIEKELRDHRVWYRFWQDWTKTEIFSRLAVGLTYALLCGLSIHYSLKKLMSNDKEVFGDDGEITIETDYLFDESLILLIAALGAFITAVVNMKGFWINIRDLINDFFGPSRKNDPKGANKVIYYLYSFVFSLTLAIFTTMLTMSGVRETLGGIPNDNLWYGTAGLFFMTFIAIWALFSQEQRKWLAGTPTQLAKRFSDFMKEMFGLKVDSQLQAKTDPNVNYTAVVTRFILAVLLLALMSYFAYDMREQMSEGTTFGFSGFLRLMGNDSAPDANLFSGANQTLGWIFFIAVTIYNMGMVKRLADLSTHGLIQSYNTLAAPAKDQNKFIQGLCVLFSLVTVIAPLYHLGKFIVNKEKECWNDAKQYAHQEKIKGSSLPWFLTVTLRMAFLNFPMAVGINAVNNATLFGEAKRADMLDDNNGEPLTGDQQTRVGAAAISAGSRSAGFGTIAVCDRADPLGKELVNEDETAGTVYPLFLSQPIERSREHATRSRPAAASA